MEGSLFPGVCISSDVQSDLGWFGLAQLLRPQGRKGELLCELLTDLDPETQFVAGREVTLAGANADSPLPGAKKTTIESFFLPVGKNAGRIVLKLSISNSISDAELFAGQQIMVPGSERPALDDDTFYVADLVGCVLFDGEKPVGEIIDVEFATGPDGKVRLADVAPLLVVELTEAEEDEEPSLIPFVRAWLVSVDVAGKRISMNLPEGLAESTTS